MSRLGIQPAYEAVTHEVQFVPHTPFGAYVVPPTSAGSALYAANCRACHGAAGGGGGTGPELSAGKFFGKPADVLAITTAGQPNQGMPGFGLRLTAAELQAIADYVAGLTPAN